MARYNLPQYQSVYRDPQSVAIHKELRDRYTNAFLADDELTAAVDGMSAADFEGDQELKNQLATEYNAKLAERARRGDYETMGTSVMRDARKFTQGYNPIKQNYDRVAAYQAELKERLNSGGENGISEEQYNHAMGLSTQGYNGLQKREDGTIDDGSFFSGTRMVAYQDISALIDERMEAVEIEKGGSKTRRVGQGPGAMYERLVGNKWERIHPDRIDAVIADVLSAPNVQAYLNQVGDMRSYNVSDDDIKESLSMTLFGNPEDVEDGGLKGQLAQLVASGKTDKKTVATMEALQEEIRLAEELLPGEGIEDSEELMLKRRQTLKNQRIQAEVMQKTGVARSTHMMNNVWTEDLVEYDQLFTARYKQQLADYTPTVFEDTGMSQINAPSGPSIKSVTEYIGRHEDLMQSVLDDATAYAIEHHGLETDETGIPLRKLTVEDIKNGNVPEGMEGLVDSYRNKIYALETQKVIAEKRLKLAYSEFGIDDKKITTDFLSATVNVGTEGNSLEVTGEQWLQAWKTATGNANLTYQEALQLDKSSQEGSIAEFRGGNKEGTQKTLRIEVANALAEITGYGSKLKNDDLGAMGGGQLNGIIAHTLQRKTNELHQADLSKINNYLEENSKLQTGGMTSNTMPGLDTKQVTQNTKAVKAHFENKLLNPNFKIFYNGQVQSDGTGTAAELINDLEWDDAAVTVTQVTFDTTPYLGEPTLQFKVKGKKDGKVVNTIVKVPYSNMQMAGMDQYFSQPSYRMALEVNIARHSQLPGTNIGFFNQNGVQTSSISWDFATGKSSGDVIRYTDVNGKVQSINAQDAAKMIDDAGRIDTKTGKPTHTFRTIKDIE
tara:strand:+ start:2778 stop:5291 length:2514 start_codon:yes stop_codon:yes gene_type:complete